MTSHNRVQRLKSRGLSRASSAWNPVKRKEMKSGQIFIFLVDKSQTKKHRGSIKKYFASVSHKTPNVFVLFQLCIMTTSRLSTNFKKHYNRLKIHLLLRGKANDEERLWRLLKQRVRKGKSFMIQVGTHGSYLWWLTQFMSETSAVRKFRSGRSYTTGISYHIVNETKWKSIMRLSRNLWETTLIGSVWN